LRDFLREDASTDDDTQSVSTFLGERCTEHHGKEGAYSLSLKDASPSSGVILDRAEVVVASGLWYSSTTFDLWIRWW